MTVFDVLRRAYQSALREAERAPAYVVTARNQDGDNYLIAPHVAPDLSEVWTTDACDATRYTEAEAREVASASRLAWFIEADMAGYVTARAVHCPRKPRYVYRD